MHASSARHLLVAAAVCAAPLLPLAYAVQAPERPRLYAVRDVRLSPEDDAPRHTLILRDGRIESVGDARADVPAGARVVEGKGSIALPAFLDAWTQTGCETPTPVADRDAAPDPYAGALVDMREANRKGIQPAFRAADALAIEDSVGEKVRRAGFGVLLSAPAGQFLAGQSALASARQAPARDVVLSPVVFDHAGFQASGLGYPGTLMGAIAQLRQFFLDAQRHLVIEERRAAGKAGPRLPYDADLDAIGPALRGGRRVACEAESAGDLDRWLSLADEFGLRIAVLGGRDAWKRAETLRDREIPVLLTLDWGEEVEDPHAEKGSAKTGEGEESKGEGEKAKESSEPSKEEREYETPLRVREEQRRLWEEKRDSAIRLAEAGVPMAFATGRGSHKELLDRVRRLVEAGLPRATALEALTSGAAAILGVGDEYGRIEPGRAASFALWTKDPLAAKDAKVAWLFTEGFPEEFETDTKTLEGEPDEGVDATGTWSLDVESRRMRSATAELSMEKGGDVRGTIRFGAGDETTERSGEFEGHVAGKEILLTGRVSFGNFEAEIVLEGEIEKDEMTGKTTWKFPRREDVRSFRATRKPKQERGSK